MKCFFFRRINDIDQLAPIVYEYSQHNEKVFYICTDINLEFYSNKIIRFLKKEKNIKIGYLHNFFVSKKLSIFIDLLFIIKNLPGNFIKKTILKIISKIYSKILNKQNIFKDFLIKNKISHLIFDFPTNYNLIYQNFTQLKQELNIRIIGIEHGILTFKNFDYTKNYYSGEYLKKSSNFDKIIVPNLLSYNWLNKNGINSEKISLAGCPRYSSKWNRILRKEIFSSTNADNDDLINVVLMDHSDDYGVNEALYLRLVDYFINKKNIDFKIKANTSSQNNDSLSSKKISKKIISKKESVELIDWCDIFICISSSIAFDAILNNKVFFYPKYLHKNKMIWENDRSCITFNSEKEIIDIFENNEKNGLLKLEEKINKEQILTTNVFANNIDHKNFILDYIKKHLN